RTKPSTSDQADTAPSEQIAAFEPTWLRYAPLTLSGLAAIGLLISLVWRSAHELDINLESFGPLRAGLDWVRHSSPAAVIATAVVAVLLVVLLGSLVVYVFQYYGYRLVREPDATLHVRRGLLTRSA